MMYINDKIEHAIELATVLKQIDCKINLIPCNPIKETDFLPSSALLAFQSKLQHSGYHVTIRKTVAMILMLHVGSLQKLFKSKKSLISITY